MNRYIFSLIAIASLTACSDNPTPPEKKPEETKVEEFVPTIEYTLAGTLPHDTLSFTEGLLFHDGKLFESTGSPEDFPGLRSVLGPVDPKTGKIDVKAELDPKTYFGEGIVFLNNKIYQLTYKNQVGFIYDAKTYKQLGRFSFNSKEGWGMTTDATSLIMSDGTNVLTYLDPQTLKVTKTLNVTNGGYAEDYLNELEYIKGSIYANVWMKNYVVKIDPASGKVTGLLNFASLTDDAKRKYRNAEVLNGIAYDSIADKIYVTGKLWKDLYQVDFKH